MHIAMIFLGGLDVAWSLWHLTYLLSGRAQHDLDVHNRLSRYTRR
jgi:hypothetical protein